MIVQAHDLKLSRGTHKFTRINGSLDEYINEEFRFEEITNRSETKQWGSFTAEKTYSYDETFYAEQSEQPQQPML